jgi:hypothetical protein
MWAYQVQGEINNVLDESDGPSTEHSATPSDESVQSAGWDVESSVDGKEHQIVCYLNRFASVVFFLYTLTIIDSVTEY